MQSTARNFVKYDKPKLLKGTKYPYTISDCGFLKSSKVQSCTV